RDVRFAGEPFVVALIPVETGGALIDAHTAAGTDLVAIVEAGGLGADPARKVLARRGRGERQGQQQDRQSHHITSSFGRLRAIPMAHRLTVMIRRNSSSG